MTSSASLRPHAHRLSTLHLAPIRRGEAHKLGPSQWATFKTPVTLQWQKRLNSQSNSNGKHLKFGAFTFSKYRALSIALCSIEPPIIVNSIGNRAPSTESVVIEVEAVDSTMNIIRFQSDSVGKCTLCTQHDIGSESRSLDDSSRSGPASSR